MLSSPNYINYNHKLLFRVRKSVMTLKRDSKIFQWEKRGENKVLIYICFRIWKLVLILIINWRIYLWKGVKVFVGNKYRYKNKLGKNKTKI